MSAREWSRRARGSVRLRVTVLAAGTFAVVLAVAAFGLVHALEGALVDDLETTNEKTLEAQAMRLMASGVPDTAEMVLTPAGAAYTLPPAGARSVVVYADDAGSFSALPATAVGATASGLPPDVMIERSLPTDGALLLGLNGEPEDYSVASLRVGGVVLATASSLDNVRDTIATTSTLLWIVGPTLVALVAVLAWLLAGRALRPVHTLTTRVAAIGTGSLHERVPEPASGDEIAELARTMNGMLGRLETETATSQRLVSDASHELRTPVAVMRAQLEVARLGPTNDWDQTSRVLLDELDRLQGLIDDLLLLARGDERGFTRAPFSVVDVTRDVAARPRRVPVEVTITADGTDVVGDERAVRRAVDHVVANAARHATSVARITVRADADRVALDVDDDGPGIPPDRRDDVVRRFVRLDDGRARDDGGAGLGLAVAADVVTAHGGRLRITESPLGGARITLPFARDGAGDDPQDGSPRSSARRAMSSSRSR